MEEASHTHAATAALVRDYSGSSAWLLIGQIWDLYSCVIGIDMGFVIFIFVLLCVRQCWSIIGPGYVKML